MQHISQSQPPKSIASHQITIQSTQSGPQFVSSVPLQVRTSSSKYETAPSQKFKQHIMPPNLPQIQTTHASIVQVQSAAAKQSSLQQSINNQIRLHQAAASQIMTGAVASPPPKQPHLNSQQPIVAGKLFDIFFCYFCKNSKKNKIGKFSNQLIEFFQQILTGANSARVSIPPLSPQGQQNRPHNMQQPGLPVQGFEANLVSILASHLIYLPFFFWSQICMCVSVCVCV